MNLKYVLMRCSVWTSKVPRDFFFLRPSVHGEHLMRSRVKALFSNLSGVVRTMSQSNKRSICHLVTIFALKDQKAVLTR